MTAREAPTIGGQMTKDTTSTIERTIVVGVDGSDSSKAALEWAAAQARLAGAPSRCDRDLGMADKLRSDGPLAGER